MPLPERLPSAGRHCPRRGPRVRRGARLGRAPAARRAAHARTWPPTRPTSGASRSRVGVASRPDLVALRRALPYYEQAVALDSAFVEAWARLSLAHSLIYFSAPLPAEAEAARGAAERALALGAGATRRGGSPWAATTHRCSIDNRQGLEQYASASVSPRQCGPAHPVGIHRAELGRWEAALEHFRAAQALDPRSVAPTLGLTQTLSAATLPEAAPGSGARPCPRARDLFLLQGEGDGSSGSG